MIENINPYNKQDWEYKFKQSDLYRKLAEDFNEISFDHFVEKKYSFFPRFNNTPRQMLAQGEDHATFGTSYFSGTIFYYIDYLLRDNPKIIYDWGCGWNIFKKYLPIIGYDPNSPYADKKILPAGFRCRSIMSMNALHFNSLTNIKNITTEFYDKIEVGGKGLLTLNVARMTPRTDMDNINTYIRTELYSFKNNLLVFDLDLSLRDAYLDGNLRMVFSK